MSSRFHQKYHRYNHHSVTPGTGDLAAYPDEGYDPIASLDSPFRGTFYSVGNIVTTETLSSNNLNVLNNITVDQTLTVGTTLSVGTDLMVYRDAFIHGDLTVLGQSTTLETLIYATSALEITNLGTGPALKVVQSDVGLSPQPIAWFVDAEGSSVIIDNNSYVGIGTENPQTDLHIQRDEEVALQIEGIRPKLTLKNAKQRFDLFEEENGSVIFAVALSAETPGSTSQELYKFKLRNENDIITVLDDAKVGINTTIPNKELTVNGELSTTNTVTIPRIIITDPSIVEIEPSSVVTLPVTAVDIEFNTTTNTTITAFTDGLRGLLYTLTNVGTAMLTLSTVNSKMYIRNGTAWKSNKYSLSASYLQLPPNFSCSLRVGSGDVVSVW